LTTEQGGFELVPEFDAVGRATGIRLGLDALRKGLGTFSVTSSVTCRNQISHTTTFPKGGRLETMVTRETNLTKTPHFQQTDPEQRRLGIPTQTQTVAKARPQGHDIFQRSTDFGRDHVATELNAKGRFVLQYLSRLVRRIRPGISTCQGGLADIAPGDFIGDIGAHEDATRKAWSEGGFNALGNQHGRLGYWIKVCACVCVLLVLRSFGKV
jgi:hypothetical protein